MSIHNNTNLPLSSEEEKFFNALEEEDVKIVRQMIEEGINVNIRNARGFWPVTHDLFAKDTSLLKLLLSKNPYLEASTFGDKTAIYYHTKYGNIESIEMVLKAGAKANRLNKFGKNILMQMFFFDDEPCPKREIIELLVKYGLDINQQDINGGNIINVLFDNDFLSSKEEKERLKKLETMLEFGLNVDSKNKNGVLHTKIIDDKDCLELIETYKSRDVKG